MIRIPVVDPWMASTQQLESDLFIAAVGYETRARFAAEHLTPQARKKIAVAFPDRKSDFDYPRNLAWYRKSGFETPEVHDQSFQMWCDSVFVGMEKGEESSLSVCVDVSSMTRFRMAVIVDTLRKLKSVSKVRALFLYSLAQFSRAPQTCSPNLHVDPVLACFAGWPVDPDRGPVAIVGLGYEQDKALGAVEHIQASQIWAFSPTSEDRRYTRAQEEANKTLLESIPLDRRLAYPVNQPLDSFVRLESLTHRILRTDNLVLLPFGPKIFALCCILIGCLYSQVAVWRVSAGETEEPLNRIPNGELCGLDVDFVPNEPE